jgi:hypothetical protein
MRNAGAVAACFARFVMALGLAGAPLPAWACNACIDELVRLRTPFVDWWLGTFYVWLTAAAALRYFGTRVFADAPNAFPTRRVLVRFLLVGTIGFLPFQFLPLQFGWIAGPGLVLCIIWIGYLLVKMASNICCVSSSRAARISLGFNLLFAAVLCAAIPAANARAGTPQGRIAHLENPLPQIKGQILPSLIGQGEVVVSELIAASERAASDGGLAGPSACFCLGAIGGDAAEQYLGDLIRTRVRFDRSDSISQWEKSACYAYAECARQRAVNDLVALHDRLTSSAAQEQRWITLVALMKTRTARGVIFALDHMEDLLRCANESGDGHDSDAASGVAEALVFYQDPVVIGHLPIYQFICWSASIAPDLKTGELGQNYFWVDHQRRPLSEIETAWSTDEDRIRAAWERVMGGRTPSD